jgi:serine/tyrosine/threonine adenylyltransferase
MVGDPMHVPGDESPNGREPEQTSGAGSATAGHALPVLSLGSGFSDVVQPARFPELRLRFRNQRWAERVGVGALSEAEFRRHFGQLEPLPGNLQQALALRYHGHQFDAYNPALGDGRGFLLAQLRDRIDGRLLDLATKGSGTTPYSRGGDGRLTLKGGVREVLATEMLEALGVYTSKSLSLFETGEALFRGDEPSPTRSSVLVRLGHSHVRIGTFQRLAYERDAERLRRLTDYCAEQLLPELGGVEPGRRPSALVSAVTRRSAELCASWMVAGFVHGVLNSDNMVVTGESFDYGPYRFLPHYDPDFVAAYFDAAGLYAFARQPRAVLANLRRLARALSLIAPEIELDAAYGGFMHAFTRARSERLLARLGLESLEPQADALFSQAVWDFLAETRMSYDQFFFDWYGGCSSVDRADRSPAAAHYRSRSFEPVAQAFESYRARDPSRLLHPVFSAAAPPTLVIVEIERIWAAIAEHDDWSAFEAKIAEIRALGAALGAACRASS